VSTDGAVRQFSGREFQMSCSLTAKGLVVCGCILKACIAEFAGLEYAGLENDGQSRRGGICRTGK